MNHPLRFDNAAEFLAQHFGYSEQNDLRDRVWVGETFQDEVRTSGREGERRSLRIEHHGMFLHLTVDPNVKVAELRELLWAIERALDRE